MRICWVLAACAAGALFAGCTTTPQADPVNLERKLVFVNHDKDGLAVQGYDVVAYFTDAKPTPGNAAFRSKWGGATYQFATADHQKLFEASPEKYAPQFGGYCGYAASINRVSPIDPNFWEILDGRLVLQHNQRAWDSWHKDVRGNLAKADQNWPGLVKENAKPERWLVNVDDAGVAVQGYDVVAYFTDSKPVMGDPQFESIYNGAKYHFASKQHREMFEDNPKKYEPQFGGYCTYAASINKVSPINPAFWQIDGDRLLLQHTQEAYDLFNKDPKGNLVKADRNWPGLVERNGRQ